MLAFEIFGTKYLYLGTKVESLHAQAVYKLAGFFPDMSDTHVIQGSEKLGIISSEEAGQVNVQEIVVNRWQELLKGTDLVPIDVHTPMCLWSRGKFRVEI